MNPEKYGPRIAVAEIGYDFIGRMLKRKFEQCIRRAGGRPFWILGSGRPGADVHDFNLMAAEYDGFLFPGGSDVDPAIYGADRSLQCGKLNSRRDRLEPQMLRAALKLDKPVLGICRGFQMINAVLGGTLYQDLKTEIPGSEAVHDRKIAFLRPVHPVTIDRDSLLAGCGYDDELMVNSVHHQAVAVLADPLKASAFSSDGIIEGFESESYAFLLGIQWHPEVLAGRLPEHRKVFDRFIQAACK